MYRDPEQRAAAEPGAASNDRRNTMSRFLVRKVAVLGAGVMGAQIAAHLVNVKVPVVLFDLPAKEGPKNGIVSKAIEGLKKLKPSGGARRNPDRWEFFHIGHGWLGWKNRLAIHISVKTFAYFFADNTPCKTLSRDDAGSVAWFLVVLVVNGLHDRMGHIQGGQIKQLEGAKFEANLVFQNAIDGGEIGHAFGNNPQRFSAVTTARMVDDETRCVVGLYWGMTHLCCKCSESFAYGWAGFQTCDDFHDLHQGDRIEKVITRKIGWSL